MKKIFHLVLVAAILLLGVKMLHPAPELTEEYMQDLADRLHHFQNNGPRPASLEGLTHPISATPLVFEAFLNRDRMSGVYKILVNPEARNPELGNSYVSPAEHFRIHYDISGYDAIYNPTLDTLDGGDGIPDYINKVAEIADSVWDFEVNQLGFPSPPKDDFYAEGLDSLFDIYILDLGAAYYGATYNDEKVDSQTYTSTMKLDNNYDFYPYNIYGIGDPRDLNRRLDAVRVTMAHEFFHAIHFAMDWTEWELDDAGNFARLYWWEMSAVWMEEMMYDDINDYYGYLKSFYDTPWNNLRFFTYASLRPYGACVFPIFLTERWGDTTVVRRIWEKCRDKGVGPQWSEAADEAIFEVSGGTHRLIDAIREFSVWNLFTGERLERAPIGVGYSEGEFYPLIPDTAFVQFSDYPKKLKNTDMRDLYGAWLPELYGGMYLKFSNTYLINDSLGFYFYGQRGVDWNVSLAGFPLDDYEPANVRMNKYEIPTTTLYSMPDIEDIFYTMVILTPVTIEMNDFNYDETYDFSFLVLDSAPPPDTTVAYVFNPPYPNPFMLGSGDETMTFSVDKHPWDLSNPVMKAVIYNVAGEKIRELDSESGTISINTMWDGKNEAGKYVAPGVYLVYCRLNSEDNAVEMTEKFKIAVF